MAGKKSSQRLRLERDRSRVETLRSNGTTFLEIGKSYGISHSMVAKIFLEWGYEPAYKYSAPKPPVKLPAFRRGAKYRIDGRTLFHLETVRCSSGPLHRFRSPAGWEETFIPAQLMGVEVREL